MKPEELLILVDSNDREIGTSEKMITHQKGLLHRAFSVFIIREKNNAVEVLLQKRHSEKYHCGGLWTNTCCGHPRPGEITVAAATRRLHEEMGIRAQLTALRQFHYIAPFQNGLTENEIDHVFVGKIDADLPFTVDRNEVEAFNWLTVNAIDHELKINSHQFTPWFKPAFEILKQGI